MLTLTIAHGVITLPANQITQSGSLAHTHTRIVALLTTQTLMKCSHERSDQSLHQRHAHIITQNRLTRIPYCKVTREVIHILSQRLPLRTRLRIFFTSQVQNNNLKV